MAAPWRKVPTLFNLKSTMESKMRQWVAEIDSIETCVHEMASAQRAWWAFMMDQTCDRRQDRDASRLLQEELFARYRQLGGEALQMGDLFDFAGIVRSPDDMARRIQQTKQYAARQQGASA